MAQNMWENLRRDAIGQSVQTARVIDVVLGQERPSGRLFLEATITTNTNTNRNRNRNRNTYTYTNRKKTNCFVRAREAIG